MRIAILDDMPSAIEDLSAKIRRSPVVANRGIEVVTFRTASSLLDYVASQGAPDVLFVDVVLLDDTQTGIDLVAKHFEGEHTQVVYVSGFLETAVDVYRTDHSCFLLKPVEAERLDLALERAFFALDRERSTLAKSQLELQIGRSTVAVSSFGIVYIESKLRKAVIHCCSETHQVYEKLDDLEQRLPSVFLRIHKGFLVNMTHIVGIDAKSVTLRDGTVLPVSQRRSKEAQRRFLGYLKGLAL